MNQKPIAVIKIAQPLGRRGDRDGGDAPGMFGGAELATRELSRPRMGLKRSWALTASQLNDVIPAPVSKQHGTKQNRHSVRGSQQGLSNRGQQRADPPPARYVSKPCIRLS